eukprot:TRINITY_DN322_c0_g1_i1.p1 TRINITY_DN322_c0_g1~~TRINITY_DN322_c0_g1_i1.p1  ORF type:complete len:334 (-),score=73.25 TRINITY_DN322_c0_g1_i1:29-955(-)
MAYRQGAGSFVTLASVARFPVSNSSASTLLSCKSATTPLSTVLARRHNGFARLNQLQFTATHFMSPVFTPSRFTTRHYADAKSENHQAQEGDTAAGKEGEEAVPLTPEQTQIKELQAKLEETHNDYLRCMADKQNSARIARQDVENAKQYGIKAFAQGMVEIADNLERALADPAASPEKRATLAEFNAFYEGVAMTERIMLSTMERYGVKKFIPAAGVDKFDPATHEALAQVTSNDHPAGTIAFVQQPGFSLHGRLLRPARVGVIKATAPSTPPTTTTTTPNNTPPPSAHTATDSNTTHNDTNPNNTK